MSIERFQTLHTLTTGQRGTKLVKRNVYRDVLDYPHYINGTQSTGTKLVEQNVYREVLDSPHYNNGTQSGGTELVEPSVCGEVQTVQASHVIVTGCVWWGPAVQPLRLADHL